MAGKEKTPEQVKAEEAAKKAADKAEKEKKAEAEQKAKDEALKKEQHAITEATGGYNTITSAKANADGVVASLSDASSVEDVKTAQTTIAEHLKTAKEGLKVVKAAGRKVKESDALKQAVTESEGLVAQIETAGKDLKDKLKVAKTAAAQAEKDKRDQEKKDAAAKKEQEKLDRQAERDAKKEPEQNGVRKPSVGTLCRAAWDLFDAISTTMGQTAPISYVLPVALEKGLNEANVKAEYARWKKYHGISGRVAVPVPANIAAAAASVSIPAPAAAEGQDGNQSAE